jgi:hypothetical protein
LNDRPVLIPRSVTRSLRMVQPSYELQGEERPGMWPPPQRSGARPPPLLLFGGVVDVAEYYIYFHTETHTGARLYMP